MLRATLKGVLAHRLRLVLTAVAVLLGVAFVSGTLVLSDTIRRTFDSFFAEASAGTDVSVRARSSGGSGQRGPFAERRPVPSSVLATVKGVEGVEAAAGTMLGYARLVVPGGREAAGSGPSIGLAWVETDELNPFRLRSGRPPRAAGEVLVDAGTADEHDIALGDRVRVLFQGPPGRFTVVGTAGFGARDTVGGATLVAFDEPTARRVLVRPDGYDTVEVAGAPEVPEAELRRRVAGVLPEGFEAVTGQVAAKESADRVKDDLGFFSTLLLVFAGVSVFVGAFMILNTFQILVAQRTRELGLLRALGAGTAQVRTAVLVEAALVGAVGSAVGVVAGVGVAKGLQRLLEASGFELPTTETVFRPRTAAVGVTLGLVVTVVSAALPARRAARVAPMAALRDDAVADAAGSLARRAAAGLGVCATGLVLVVAGTSGAGDGPTTVALGAVVGFVGVALVAPAVTRPVARIVGAPLAALGFSGRLGRQNAMRNPRRTAATAAALMVGLALVTLVTIFAASARRSTGRVIDEVFTAELVVTGDAGAGGFSPEVAKRLRGLPEVAAVAEFRHGAWRWNGREEFLTAADPASLGRVLDLRVVAGAFAAERPGLLVHEDEARARGLAVGDVVAMEFERTGLRRVPVVGVFEANQLTGDYVLALEEFEASYAGQLDDFAMVELRPGSGREARAAVDRVVRDFPDVTVQDQGEFKDEVAAEVDRILNLFYGLLALAIVIALLGIVNTLALSVFERTRELGLLRAVGTSRRQVAGMVRAEGAIIATLGAVLGLVVGTAVALAMLRALREEGITDTAVPGLRLVAFVAVAGVAGLAAALVPARRVARLDILRAIAHE